MVQLKKMWECNTAIDTYFLTKTSKYILVWKRIYSTNDVGKTQNPQIGEWY